MALRETARRYSAIVEAFWRECVVDASVLAEWTVNVGRRSARARTAHLICEVACRYGADDEEGVSDFCFPATQTYLGDMMALTLSNVNRTLQSLWRDGLVELHRRVVRILNWDALVEVGEFDPTYVQIGTSANDNLVSVSAGVAAE